ncbi:hypothetical protein D9611_015078 [Ephemerocybe angulata]|uniref:DNA 3'-5' helicase n=1 Tax=Ephemerocybe angulata TaxID=980116 RepID=A0A8H5EZZ5_9AGAR|nr:hypothetical protein D9611_015078 [Tulosesus angulatus]
MSSSVQHMSQSDQEHSDIEMMDEEVQIEDDVIEIPSDTEPCDTSAQQSEEESEVRSPEFRGLRNTAEDKDKKDESDDEADLNYRYLPNDLLISDRLQQLGLAINEELRLYVCLPCEQAYTSVMVGKHIHKVHKVKLTKDLVADLAAISSKKEVADSFPDLESERVPTKPFAGIAVQTEFGCPTCAYAGGAVAVRLHINKAHEGDGRSMEHDISVQCINKGVVRTYIRVLAANAVPVAAQGQEPTTYWQQQFAEIHTSVLTTARSVPNARLISPWLMRTGYPELVVGAAVSDLRELVALPKATDDLAWLHALVVQYMKEATALINKTQLAVRQRLNSNNSEFETPHWATITGDTVKQYCVPVVHLVAGLLRKSCAGFKFASTTKLDKALKSLKATKDIKTLHAMFKTLWLCTWDSRASTSFPNPTLSFLGLFTLKAGGDFALPKNVTGTITKLTRAIQLVALTEFHNCLATPNVIEDTLIRELGVFTKLHESTTFSDLGSLQKYASFLSYKTVSLPKIVFPNRGEDDYSLMLFEGKKITLDNVGTVFGNLDAQMLRIFKEEILFGLDLHVDYTILADNMSSPTPGYCFLDDPGNPFKDRMYDLGNKVFTTPALFARFMTEASPGYWVVNVHEARKWLQSLSTLEVLMCISANMRGGSSARGAEMCSMLIRNRNTRMRNLIAVGKYVSFIGQYSKNTHNQESDRMIPHALCGFDQDLTIQVHTFARPFAVFLAKSVWPEEPEIPLLYHEMLFMDLGKELDSDKASKAMGAAFSVVIAWVLMIAAWRHISTGWRTRLCKGAIDSLMEEETMSSLHALQSGHSVRTESRIYGIDHDSLGGVSQDVIQLFMEASVAYQKMFKIPPGGLGLRYDECTMDVYDSLGLVPRAPAPVLQGPAVDQSGDIMAFLRAFRTSSEKGQAELQAEVKALAGKVDMLESELKATKSVRLDAPPTFASPLRKKSVQLDAPQTFASPLREASPGLEYVDADADAVFLPESPVRTLAPAPVASSSQVAAARLAPFPQPMLAPTPQLSSFRPPRATMTPIASSPRLPPLATSSSKTMLPKLAKLYGPGTNWRVPEQRQAVEALLKLEGDVIVALPTGIGKTAIAILPSMVEASYTVIILPLLSLQSDWFRRLDEFRIPYEHFQGAQKPVLQGHANLIIVSCDKIRMPHWQAAIAGLPRPIARYIFDEAHYYFTDDVFRADTFSNPHLLRQQATCQFVLLSATLPPAGRKHLTDKMLLTNVTTISSPSARPEHRYWLAHAKGQSAAKSVHMTKMQLERCQSRLKWNTKDRYMVFVTSLEDGTEVAKALDIGFYHSDSERYPLSDDARELLMADFIAGRSLGLVCTTALAAGTDYPHIRLTIHYGTPHDMITFVQQSGRAGRDGQEAYCVLIARGYGGSLSAHHADMRGIRQMKRMTKVADEEVETWPLTCMRYNMSEVLDGQGVNCLDLDKRYFPCYACDLYGQVNKKTQGKPSNQVSDLLALDLQAPAPETAANLKRRLSISYHSAVVKSTKLTTTAMLTKQAALTQYSTILDLVKKNCGACFAMGLAVRHNSPYDCPNIDRDIFIALRQNIKYDRSNKTKAYKNPCWTCHISSMGGNLLHPVFKSGMDHPNRDLVLPLLSFIWADDTLRGEMGAFFKVEWHDLDAFIVWLVSEVLGLWGDFWAGFVGFSML